MTKTTAKFTNIKTTPARRDGFKRSRFFDIDLYRCRFRVVITNNVGAYMKDIHRADGFSHAEGACVSNGHTSEVILRVENGTPLSYEAIVHEATHLAQSVLGHIGCKPDYENQEPLSYLNGHVGGIILRTLHRWRVPVK